MAETTPATIRNCSMAAPTFRFKLRIAEKEREGIFASIWRGFENQGLIGIHEGTILSEEAFQLGLETESFTVDAGEAPRERDWIGTQSHAVAELYFVTQAQAEYARGRIQELYSLECDSIEEVQPQDWDAEWKKSFQGIDLLPYWKVLPPWVDESVTPPTQILRINPGAGFGTGTHETTQLCLKSLAEINQKIPLSGKSVFDFGSGSGILSIGAAILGAKVTACEIDPLANENATDNAKLNQVEISLNEKLPPQTEKFDLVIANILRPVLLQFCQELCSRIKPGGNLLLSGLVENDLSEIQTAFSQYIKTQPQIRSQGDWRSILW